MSTYTILKVNQVFATKDDFMNKLIDPLKKIDSSDYTDETKMFSTWDQIYDAFISAKGRRYLRFEEDEFLDYLKIEMLRLLPKLYTKQMILVNETLTHLKTDLGQINKISQRNKGARGTDPSDAGIGASDEIEIAGKGVDEFNASETELKTEIGLIKQAEILSKSDITQELVNFIHSFDDLLLSINDEKVIDELNQKFALAIPSFYKQIQAIIKAGDGVQFITNDNKELIEIKVKDQLIKVWATRNEAGASDDWAFGFVIGADATESGFYIKTDNNLLQFKDWAEVKAYTDEADKNIQLNIDDVKNVSDEAFIKARNMEAQVNSISAKVDALSGGVRVFHYATEGDATGAIATSAPNENDIAWIGTTGDWIGYHFIGGAWVKNGTSSTHQATLDAYTKAESDAKYAPKEYDYSNTNTLFTKIALQKPDGSNGRGQNIAKPATEDAKAGAKIVLKLKDGNATPADMAIDADPFYYEGKALWIVKGSDQASYSEIKSHIIAGEELHGIKQEDGSLLIDRWVKPVEYVPRAEVERDYVKKTDLPAKQKETMSKAFSNNANTNSIDVSINGWSPKRLLLARVNVNYDNSLDLEVRSEKHIFITASRIEQNADITLAGNIVSIRNSFVDIYGYFVIIEYERSI